MSLSIANWQPLRILADQFEANLQAMRGRPDGLCAQLADALASLAPPREYLVGVDNQNRVHLAIASNPGADSPQILPTRVSPEAASQIATKLFPSGHCTEPVLIAGLDHGWLWSALYHLPIHTPTAPGHTPPLYFLTGELERLWAVLHVQDWRQMLADARVRLFGGVDAVAQAQQSMASNLLVPFPKLSVTVDPSTWMAGASIDSVTSFALQAANARMSQLKSQVARAYASADPSIAFESPERKLRVMGITSRFTTFLQYSMRDWLDAFEALGHETQLVIEPENCSLANPLLFAEACASFQPDLIVMIDHYRGEFGASIPANVPFVMWVQDQLPNIFRPQAGAAQGRYDYTIGYGRLDCVYDNGYPAERFMPVMLGTNEKRFHPRRLIAGEYTHHACDVSFVSHCSTPAEIVLQQEISRQSAPETRKLFELTFAKLKSRYDAGQAVTLATDIRAMLDEALAETRLSVDRPDSLLSIFTHKVNNALFRHQALEWLIELAERDNLRVHIYGRGWENHPRFAPYAKGVADNETALSAIYQASKINLQISPFGSAHQRVFDGLCAGGFFLLRGCDGDRSDRILRDLSQWIAAHPRPITSDAQLQAMLGTADPHLDAWIAELTRIHGHGPFGHNYDFVTELSVTASCGGFDRSAATLWDEQYDQIVFNSQPELYEKVRAFVHDDAARVRITRPMRQRVIDQLTYRAIAERTIDFVRRDLVAQASPQSIAA